MNVNEIKIFFQTIFNRSGSDAAKKAIREVTRESGAATVVSRQTSEAVGGIIDVQKGGRSNKTVQIIGDIRQAVGGLSGGIAGATSGLQGLIKLFPSMAMFAGPIGIASAAFGGLIAAATKFHEWLVKQDIAIAQSKFDQLAAKLDRATEAYSRQKDAIDEALAARKAFDASGSEVQQAQRRAEDAQMELEYRQQMAALGEDQIAKDQLAADYANRKATVAVLREQQDSEARLAAQLDEETTANEKINVLMDERAAKIALLNDLVRQQNELAGKANRSFLGSTMEAYAKQSQSVGESVSKTLSDIAVSDKEIRQTQQTATVANARSMAAGADVQRIEATAGVNALDYTAANKTVQKSRDTEALAALDRLNEAVTGMSPDFVRGLQKVVDNLNAQKRFTAAEIDRLTRDAQIQRQRSIGF